ncbi:cytochrome c biogenesis protein CcsA [Paenibacillus eucommiae]|uniref:ABC-type transport system involved in cytochrome c biogenesis permease subunit n=1 Tax=Paenibacillus eucommiae TaxID=1355755 RepID=A0ABS4IPT4_9BACL|nr:cytochrome c biogenesis protein CcsA [Paenibacillus eucommiae]MBP1988931.1 ABC-type transport system involved in cytochrome c biogenesis permease subunit [Paenibacillus eucommiae]
MNLNSLSSTFLLIAFFVYIAAFLFFVLSIIGRRWSNRNPEEHTKSWGKFAFIVSVIGFLCQLTYFFTRWYDGGRIPTANMYEFMTFLGMMIMLAFIIVYLIYRTPALGIFALPVGFIIIAYASVFPSEIQPLIPALQSYWLKIHVTTAAAGEAFFAIGFAGGLMYLLRAIDFKGTTKQNKREQRGIEFTIFVVLVLVCFIGSVFTFHGFGYESTFSKEVTIVRDGVQTVETEEEMYVLPPIVKPHGTEIVKLQPFLGMTKPLFEAPSWMKGGNAGRQLNTMIWSILLGIILYGLIRLIARKPLGAAMSPLLKDMDSEDLDEISYRAIAIGYPVFTLGALIFAMIWAQEAWGRFWGWDPKEVWALITWLFYAVFLHLRLSKGWQGKKSAWLAVIGFLVVMFTLVGVNLIISGLHSYAGV